MPLVSEFVFRAPKHNDPTEKEVIDHLIIHNNQSILISQKAQEDPDKRPLDMKSIEGRIDHAYKATDDVLRLEPIRDSPDGRRVCAQIPHDRGSYSALLRWSLFHHLCRLVTSSSAWISVGEGFLCQGLRSRWFTERFHRNALVTHIQHGQVFCTARRLENYAVARCRLHQRAPQR